VAPSFQRTGGRARADVDDHPGPLRDHLRGSGAHAVVDALEVDVDGPAPLLWIRVAQVRDRLDQFGDAAVAVITFTKPDAARAYRESNGVPFPILIDGDREVYRSFGLDRGTVRRVWGWRAGRRYVEIARARGLGALRRPNEDTLQLGGDFVVGADGLLAYGFWGQGPDDRPDIGSLVAAVEGAQR